MHHLPSNWTLSFCNLQQELKLQLLNRYSHRGMQSCMAAARLTACMPRRFLGGDDSDPAVAKKRHSMLKLIPSVVKGSWIIKQSVGNTPVLLGSKVKTTYHRWAQSLWSHSSRNAALLLPLCSMSSCAC